MSAQAHLASYNVTLEAAKQFIMSNLSRPDHILEVCQQFGVTNAMLAEIYGQGVNAQTVINFFASQNLDSTNLDAEPTTQPTDAEQPQWLSGYIGSADHGRSDGYHDGYLEGFVEHLYNDMAQHMDAPEWLERTSFFAYNADGSTSPAYQSAYSEAYSGGFSDGNAYSDYTNIYLSESPAFSPVTQLGLDDLALLGTSDGYRNGYFSGLHALVSNADQNAYYNEYQDIEISNDAYSAAYLSAYDKGIADGYHTNDYQESIYAIAQLEQAVIELFV